MEKFQSDSYLIGLLITVVDDIFDDINIAALVEFHNFHLSLVEEILHCGQMFQQIVTDDCWHFPLICRRTCEYEPLLQFIPLKLGYIACCDKCSKVDKLCALRFITVIKAYDWNSSYYQREGSSFITSELGGFK